MKIIKLLHYVRSTTLVITVKQTQQFNSKPLIAQWNVSNSLALLFRTVNYNDVCSIIRTIRILPSRPQQVLY